MERGNRNETQDPSGDPFPRWRDPRPPARIRDGWEERLSARDRRRSVTVTDPKGTRVPRDILSPFGCIYQTIRRGESNRMEIDPIRWDSLLSIRSPLSMVGDPLGYFRITILPIYRDSIRRPHREGGSCVRCARSVSGSLYSSSIPRETACEDIETPRPILLDGAYSIPFRLCY